MSRKNPGTTRVERRFHTTKYDFKIVKIELNSGLKLVTIKAKIRFLDSFH